METKSIILLDKEALIEQYGTKANVYNELVPILRYEPETLQSYNIFGEKPLRPEVAMRLDEVGMSEYYLNIRTLLYNMCVTGTTLFGTNEKIALAPMLFDYSAKKHSWTSEEIYSLAKPHVKSCTLSKIEEALKNERVFKYNSEAEQYSINVHGICSLIKERMNELQNGKIKE